MFFAEVFAEIFFFDTRFGIEDEGEDTVSFINDKERRRRLQDLDEIEEKIDLFEIINIEIIRGSDDTSAS